MPFWENRSDLIVWPSCFSGCFSNFLIHISTSNRPFFYNKEVKKNQKPIKYTEKKPAKEKRNNKCKENAIKEIKEREMDMGFFSLSPLGNDDVIRNFITAIGNRIKRRRTFRCDK